MLKERQYTDKYCTLHPTTMEFSRKSRNVAAFKVASVFEHQEEP